MNITPSHHSSYEPPYLSALPEAVRAIHEASDILLACHVNPDGDTLGCMLALALALDTLGKQTTLLSADGVPPTLAFLPGVERVQTETARRDFDLAIVLDAGEIKRIGDNREAAESAPVLMDIDHHVTPGAFGNIRLLDGRAAATGEILYDLLQALEIGLTPDIAQCLMCALLTDTGSFRYLNVTPRTMAIASELLAAGASPNQIAEEVFENRSFAAQKLLGRALQSLNCSEDGRISWAYVTQQDFTDFAASDSETEGIISAVRAVRGSQVALFLREMSNGKLRVSLRARPPYDVAAVAMRFGGGGHYLAAGCTLEGPLPAALESLVAATQEAMAAQDSNTAERAAKTADA
ncbi:MAG: bifunctional oligoribonuclease/PAP phosphatase NrnA [Armatimonadaceae bacterium]